MQVCIVFDTSEAEAQADELAKLFREVFPDGISDDLVSNIRGLCSDVSITDGGTTFGTDGVMEQRLLIRFGSRFHDVMSALRAGKLSDFIHVNAPMFRDS